MVTLLTIGILSAFFAAWIALDWWWRDYVQNWNDSIVSYFLEKRRKQLNFPRARQIERR